MGDFEAVGAESWTTVPTPREPGDVQGVPGNRREWVTLLGQVAGLLCALREAEVADGAVLPVPLAHGTALRAWAAATRPVLHPGATATIELVALRLVGHAARVLGDRLCRARATGVDDLVTAVLRCEAAVHGHEPEWLVAQIARVHGVLTARDAASGRVVWHALDEA